MAGVSVKCTNYACAAYDKPMSYPAHVLASAVDDVSCLTCAVTIELSPAERSDLRILAMPLIRDE